MVSGDEHPFYASSCVLHENTLRFCALIAESYNVRFKYVNFVYCKQPGGDDVEGVFTFYYQAGGRQLIIASLNTLSGSMPIRGWSAE